MNDDELRMLAKRHLVYRLDDSRRRRRRALWLLPLALVGMAALWWLWPQASPMLHRIGR